MPSSQPTSERRRFERLPIAIPLLVRGYEEGAGEFTDFATALNVSGGGILMSSRRYLSPSTRINLEIPSGPLPPETLMTQPLRSFRAEVVRTTPVKGWYFVSLRFTSPVLVSRLSRAA